MSGNFWKTWIPCSGTDLSALAKIVSTWVIYPILSACFAIFLFKATSFAISRFRVHMFRLD